MKIIAKECQTPVLALAQLSRKVEDNNLTIVKGIKKTVREPQMSDLADSSGIEKDANMISFL
jgi:replicative DNA helicase